MAASLNQVSTWPTQLFIIKKSPIHTLGQNAPRPEIWPSEVVINHHCHFLRPKTFPQTITSSVTKLVRSKQVLGTPFIGNWAQNAAFLRRGMTRFHMFLPHLLPTKTPRPEPVGSMYGIFIPRCIIKKSTQLGRFSIPYPP